MHRIEKEQYPRHSFKGGFMRFFRRIALTLGIAVFCCGLAVTAGNAQGRHWGRHDNGRHLGWYKHRSSRVYYGTSYYPTYRYRRSYRGVRYYPTYYSRYSYRRAYWRRFRMRRAYWRYRHYRRYRYSRYRRL